MSQLELDVQGKNHSIDDLQDQIKLLKKRDELNQEKIKKLQLQVEELKKDTDLNMSNPQRDDLQQ